MADMAPWTGPMGLIGSSPGVLGGTTVFRESPLPARSRADPLLQAHGCGEGMHMCRCTHLKMMMTGALTQGLQWLQRLLLPRCACAGRACYLLRQLVQPSRRGWPPPMPVVQRQTSPRDVPHMPGCDPCWLCPPSHLSCARCLLRASCSLLLHLLVAAWACHLWPGCAANYGAVGRSPVRATQD